MSRIDYLVVGLFALLLVLSAYACTHQLELSEEERRMFESMVEDVYGNSGYVFLGLIAYCLFIVLYILACCSPRGGKNG